MSPHPQYGSIKDKDDDEDLDVELLATTHVGDVDATGDGDGENAEGRASSRMGNRRRRIASYVIAGLICLLSARYWRDRRAAGGAGGEDGDGRDHRDAAVAVVGRVPETPALSSLDPVVDLGFRATTRTGDALPSSAWGEHHGPPGRPSTTVAWNHNMRPIVRGNRTHGEVRWTGKDPVLPTILAGNRVISALIDTDDADNDGLKEEGGTTSSSKKNNNMLCGSFTGKPIEQDPKNHPAAISSDGKAEVYSVKRELVLHMDQSDFTWVVFFSRPVKVQCYSDSIPLVSSPGDISDLQFRLNVVEVSDGADPDNELVVRMALLNECTTGKSIIKEHCDVLSTLGYETVSSKEKSRDYMNVLREGAMLYPKSPLVGTQFPDKEGDDSEDSDRVTNVVFDWDVASVDSKGSAHVTYENARASVVAGSFGLRPVSSNSGVIDRLGKSKIENDAFVMFALPHHLEYLSTNSDSDAGDSLCLHTFHGRTCLVQGSVWTMPVSHGKPQSFIADRPPAANAIPLIAKALSEEIKYKISDNMLRGAADTYFPAKIIAKMGRIIEIKEELQRLKSGGAKSNNYSDADDSAIEEATSAAAAVSLPSEEEVESLLDNLQQSVEIWLNPGGKEKGGAEAEFLYDASWGGFVNCGCNYTFVNGHEGEGTCSNAFPECPALADVNQDFGNGWYNDHHFHYGYHIYAAAIVAKHRPEWARKYNDRILLYIRDIANPSAEDKNFPMFRQKDWYLGNSWAGGLMSILFLFQTWFSSEPVVSYGIQLIPLTAVAERRDDPVWSKIMYPVYAESCKSANEAHDGFCEKNGWSIFEPALLAEIGKIDDALNMALEIPTDVFISEGACGNSLANTLWFISTRKQS
ncbi:hypothetical protein ACHAW5_000368 [Stephanodiscus triporus]|uniref:glucan endo-1,3-beta-D-glucosidase n=1 Tax=Stephanodiscus triporus TaxID=2934178 RepID=A0ABD3Q0Q5_9STRA